MAAFNPPAIGSRDWGAPLVDSLNYLKEQTDGFATSLAGKVDESELSSGLAGKVSKGDLLLNVKNYGATGDGVADDTAAIAAALAVAANSVAGGVGATVYLPRGTYLTTGHTLPQGVRFRGDGQAATRLKVTGANTALTLDVNCVVSDMKVTGAATAGSVGIAFVTNSHHVSVTDTWCTGLETGIKINNTWIVALTRVTIQSCTNGLYLTGSDTNGIVIYGGEIQGCTNGVFSDLTIGVNIAFTGVTIEGNSGYGVLQSGGPYGISFRDCYFESNTSGHIRQTYQSRMLVVSGCTFSGATPVSLDLVAALDTLVEGNVFLCSGTSISVNAAIGVHRLTMLRNWYAPGQEFSTTNYKGDGLLLLDRDVRFTPSTTTAAGLNIPHGVAPSAPKNGDIWTTAAGLFVQINGATVGPLS